MIKKTLLRQFFTKQFFTILLAISTLAIYAQVNVPEKHQPLGFSKAIELYQSANYIAAGKILNDLKNSTSVEEPVMFDIDYYRLMCLVKQNKRSAEEEIMAYLNRTSGSPWENQLYFEMARLQFHNKRYKLAAKTFDQIEPSLLNSNDFADYKFYQAYSHFESGNNKRASQGFYDVKRGTSIYANSASYYWAYINYLEGNYETALQEFKRVEKDRQFASFIPFYTIQIYYLQGNYDKVIEFGNEIILSAPANQKNELNKILGDAYFETGQHIRAIQYLEAYKGQNGKRTREEFYRLAYCYFQVGEYQKAADAFDKVTLQNDALAQNAYYHLADCFLKMNDKSKARVAFERASQSSFDPQIEEDALFNFAKLTYELSYSPFNETIKAFDQYISKYPNSERNDAAFDYLVKVYMTTRNYRDAIASIEKIKVQSPSVKEALQRVTYFRGLELFVDGQYASAIDMFRKSLDHAVYNRSYRALSFYWSGEAFFRLGKFTEAIKHFTEFQNNPGAFSLPEFGAAYYHIGYSYYHEKKYEQANSWFRKYLTHSKTDPKMKADAMNRIADTYYIDRDYSEAIKYYNTAITANIYDTDYALFQRAKSYGIIYENQKKIADLQNLIKTYPRSSFVDDAYYEMGRTYERIQNTDQAILSYQNLIKQLPQSNYARQALLQLGLIYYNRNDNRNSMTYYKQVVESYPGTEEAEAALTGIKNNYVDMNDVDGFFAYAKTVGGKTGTSVSASAQDSTYYMAAEKSYMAGTANAAQQLEDYLQRFPQGSFKINATYYLAETYYGRGEFSRSLKFFEEVTAVPDNIFTEPAIIKAGELTYNAGRYDQALAYFARLDRLANTQWNRLRARAGIMRCNYQMENWAETVKSATVLLGTDKITDLMQREAHIRLANSYYKLNEANEALKYYSILAQDVKTIEGAESKYMRAKILLEQKNTNAAEKEVLDFIEINTPHQYWLAKAFILLSDVYVAKNNAFEAKGTLKSILDNYNIKDDGIIKEAREKLNILESEQNESIDNR
jgi:TolA-binding protein